MCVVLGGGLVADGAVAGARVSSGMHLVARPFDLGARGCRVDGRGSSGTHLVARLRS